MVNPRYGLDSREWIHFAFTVMAGPIWRKCSGLRLVGINQPGPAPGPLVLCPTMGAEHPPGHRRQTGKGHLVDLDAGVERLSANGTTRENLRHAVPPLRG